MQDMGIITQEVEPLRFVYGKYYRDCLMKLRIFQLIQYHRIVFMDTDTMPLNSLDHLFDLPVPIDIAAPRAYWLKQKCVTSFLLVVRPSLEMWNRVQKHFESAFEKRYYDMDIINLEFKDEMWFLPDEYGCLNSEWESMDGPFHFGPPEESYRSIKIVHFSAVGKPWFYCPEKVRQLRPHAHPNFYDLWETWWKMRNEILRERMEEKVRRIARSFRSQVWCPDWWISLSSLRCWLD